MKAILSIDQSTQGTKGLLWDLQGNLLSRVDVLHRQIVDCQGWVSHDLHEIWKNVRQAAASVLEKAGVAPEDVWLIGLTNQRETACCWDAGTGEPLCDAIVWQCARAQEITDALRQSGFATCAYERTGLPVSPFFSAPKFAWALKHVDAVRLAADEGRLMLGTVDSYLLYRMVGEHKTDFSNASRTGLMNLDTLDWDAECLKAYGLRREWLPRICMSDSLFGFTDMEGLFPSPVPVHGVLGDSHAALYAHGCTEAYSAKVTYGTGSSVMMNAGERRPAVLRGLATSLAWGMEGRVVYCIEGNINYAGAVITWLIRNMKLLDKPERAGKIASNLSGNGGVYLVPAFSGLGAPYYENDAQAAIVGMNRTTSAEHIVRAAMECIAYQVYDILHALTEGISHPLTRLCADGGPSQDAFLMQFQADLLMRPIAISRIEELSGAGAAKCAALGSGRPEAGGFLSGYSTDVVAPKMDETKRRHNLCGWKRAMNMVIDGGRSDCAPAAPTERGD